MNGGYVWSCCLMFVVIVVLWNKKLPDTLFGGKVLILASNEKHVTPFFTMRVRLGAWIINVINMLTMLDRVAGKY
jgi:hypothetical protein